jgi:hypothetical protein
MNIVKKCLTKPIWWWERNRPYAIKENIFRLKPKKVFQESKVKLLMLVGMDEWWAAHWSLYSLLNNLTKPMGVVWVVDRLCPEEFFSKTRLLFPSIEIYYSFDLIERVSSEWPNLFQYAHLNPMGRKLVANLWVNEQADLLYADSDVLAFNPMDELMACLEVGEPCYNPDVHGLNADQLLLQNLKHKGLNVADDLNAGFFFAPQGSLNREWIESNLQWGKYDSKCWFSEQTLMAAAMKQLKARALSKKKYVVSTQRQFYFEEDVDYSNICMRHFVQPVRHVMYLKGMPYLYKKWTS